MVLDCMSEYESKLDSGELPVTIVTSLSMSGSIWKKFSDAFLKPHKHYRNTNSTTVTCRVGWLVFNDTFSTRPHSATQKLKFVKNIYFG